MADLHFECPQCAQPIEAAEEMANSLIECPSCHETIEVPACSALERVVEECKTNPITPPPLRPLPTAVNPNEHYWLCSGLDQKGPYTLSQIQSMWRTGLITADTLYCQQGFSEWVPISRITDILDPPKPVPPHTPALEHLWTMPLLKNPMVAAVLSFLCPGLGQIYNGEITAGIALFILTLLLYFTIIFGIIIHIYTVYDAYSSAARMNEINRL